MHKIACPKCQEDGGDTTGDNLSVYDDNHGYCHACGHYMKDAYEQETEKMTDSRDIEQERIKVHQIQKFPVGAPHKPHLSRDACEMYGVRYSVNEYDGEASAVYYPLYEDKQVTRYKVRYLPKDFRGIGDKNDNLFGEQFLVNGGKFLVITEGEDDTLAAMTMFMSIGKKYRTTSLPNGADKDGKIDPATKKKIQLFAKFEKIVICFDNDGPGKATGAELAELLAPLVEVRITQFPDGIKDADDMCRAGMYREFMECINNAEEYTPEGIIEGSQITLESLQAPMQAGYSLPYPDLQNKLHGLRKGEITLTCAGSGIGKTTMCREIGYHLVRDHGLTVGNVFLEEKHDKTATGYIAIDNNVPLAKLRSDKTVITQGEWERSLKDLIHSNKTHYFKHFGSIASERLFNKLLYMIHGLGCDFIILDHITLVLSGSDSDNERKDIDILMTRLAELCNETGVGVIAVVHLKRKGGSQEKGFNQGGEVAITDLRGSSQLEALSWNILALERDQQNENLADMSKIRVLKNREWGFTGIADTLQYSHITGRLLPAGREL